MTKKTQTAISVSGRKTDARGQAGIRTVGNLKHTPSRLCCPWLRSSPPLTLWRMCNQRWRQETILTFDPLQRNVLGYSATTGMQREHTPGRTI